MIESTKNQWRKRYADQGEELKRAHAKIVELTVQLKAAEDAAAEAEGLAESFQAERNMSYDEMQTYQDLLLILTRCWWWHWLGKPVIEAFKLEMARASRPYLSLTPDGKQA